MNSCGHRRSSWFRCSPGRSGVQLLFDSFADHAGVMTTQTVLASDRAPSGRYHPSAVQDDDPAAQSNASGDTSDTSWEASGPLADDRPATDSVIAERLWDAMHRARTGETEQSTADLEDAAFRYYLPMARSLAHSMCGASNDRVTAEQAAELGLAHAVLAWRQRSSAGFRRFARSAIMRQISSR